MRLLTRLELHELKDRRQKEGDRHRGQEVDHRQGLRHGSCEVWLLLHLEDDDAVLGRRHAPVFWVDKHCEGGETQKRNFVGIRRWLVVLSWKGWLPYPLTNQKLVLKQVKRIRGSLSSIGGFWGVRKDHHAFLGPRHAPVSLVNVAHAAQKGVLRRKRTIFLLRLLD